MTKIKICGLVEKEDVWLVNRYLPDYAGIVFVKSKRQVDETKAKELRGLLDSSIPLVGVFVNENPDYILKLCQQATIDIIQLHGDEDEACIQYIKERVPNPIIKAIRVKETKQISEGEKLSCDYLLLDTYQKDCYGGSGQAFDLSLVPELKKPFFLAGGLDGNNVNEKIKQIQPFAVDISSGVENETGRKDSAKVKEFIEKIRRNEPDESR